MFLTIKKQKCDQSCISELLGLINSVKICVKIKRYIASYYRMAKIIGIK